MPPAHALYYLVSARTEADELARAKRHSTPALNTKVPRDAPKPPKSGDKS